MSVISYRRIFAIAFPVIAANVLLPFQGLIDTAIIGHFPNPAYLAALGLASSFFALLYASFNFLQYASSGLSAQALGKKDYQSLFDILWRAWIMILVIAATILVFFPFLTHLAHLFFGMTTDTAAFFDTYSNIRIWGIFAELGIYVCLGWFSGQGLGKYILIQQITLTLSNIALSLFFVYGLGLAIEGVALGTVIANYTAITFSIFLIYRRCHLHEATFFPKSFKRLLRWDILKPLILLNRDLFIRTIALVFCLNWFQRLASHQGDLFLAANVILLWLLTIASYALDGTSVAIESLSGQAFAKKDTNLLKDVIQKTFITGSILAVILTLIFYFSFPVYLSMMTSLEDVRNIAFSYRYWAIFIPIIGVASYLLDGYYFGTMQSATLRNSMLAVAALIIPSSLLLTYLLGNTGIWISIYLFLLLRAIFLAPTLLSNMKA